MLLVQDAPLRMEHAFPMFRFLAWRGGSYCDFFGLTHPGSAFAVEVKYLSAKTCVFVGNLCGWCCGPGLSTHHPFHEIFFRKLWTKYVLRFRPSLSAMLWLALAGWLFSWVGPLFFALRLLPSHVFVCSGSHRVAKRHGRLFRATLLGELLL